MQAAHERRVDGAVNPGALGVGETVEVRTLMGDVVGRGDVYGVTPFGVTISEDGTNHKFYQADFFLFVPEAQELPHVASNLLADAHPDARVAAKLHRVSGSCSRPAGMQEMDGLSGAGSQDRMRVNEQDSPEAAGNNAEPVDDEEDAPAEEPTPAEQGAVADDSSSVDVDQLPDDIKKAVVTVQKLDGDQMNYVLAQAGQAMMSALRRSNVSEAELHGLVQKSQNAIYRILTGKPAKEWKKVAAEK